MDVEVNVVGECPDFEVLDVINKDQIETAELKAGMKFDTVEEMYECYRIFGMQEGFGVFKRSSRKDHGILRHVCYCCVRWGKHKNETRMNVGPTAKIGCKAHISAKLFPDEKWRIVVLVVDHTHKLCPESTRHLRCNKKIDIASKNKLLLNHKAGIRTNQSFHSLAVGAGGYEKLTFDEKDARNMLKSEKLIQLGEGDAAALQSYFVKMQKQCTNFFYSIDMDKEGRLKNVFWDDERCIQAYKEFGEVITFDTTYLTNRYDMPFAPFVGVNHHGQSTLFGCGLLSNETTQTFVWLFETWLNCMGGCAPTGIVTDQDSGMKAAVEIVFPDTKHRWCIWHIMKKILEKLSSYGNYKKIKSKLKRVVYNSQSPSDFEKGWSEMFQRYKSLEQSKWLGKLYKEKERWVPCFVKTYFWAGMSSTQRSESMNAFFDNHVTAKTSLKEFVERYESAVRYKIEKESKADARSFFTIIPTKTQYEMEKQVENIYTAAMFLEFQEELIKKTYCEVINIQDESPMITYHIEEQIWIPKPLDDESCVEKESTPDSPLDEEKQKIMIRVMFKVSFQKNECSFECTCHNFEFRGIVCRHAIIALHRNDIFLLPKKYLLKIWRKDVKRIHTEIPVSFDAWQLNPKQRRYNELCTSFAVLAEVASSSDVMSTDIKNWIQDKLKVSDSNARTFCKSNTGLETTNSTPIETKKVSNPPATKKKGRARQTIPKSKTYTAKKSRKGIENAEVNIPISAQQANKSTTNLPYDQYLQVLQFAPIHLQGHGAVHTTPAYGITHPPEPSIQFGHEVQPGYGVQPHSFQGGLQVRTSQVRQSYDMFQVRIQ